MVASWISSAYFILLSCGLERLSAGSRLPPPHLRRSVASMRAADPRAMAESRRRMNSRAALL
jgi:hypothetical protein